jgi:hypothetical protein
MSSDVTAEQLVTMYINKAGKVNAQFTRQIRKVSSEIREETMAMIISRGLPAYTEKPQRAQKTPKTGIIKLAPIEQTEKPAKITTAMIHELLEEVRKERKEIAERLKTLDIVDDYYIKKLVVLEAQENGDVDEPFEAPDQQGYEVAHAHAANNRNEIIRSTNCGCFYCGEIFAPTEITRWLDDWHSNRQRFTATCPRCGVDAVIGDKAGYVFSKEFLSGMYDRWFSTNSGVGRCDTSTENQSTGPAVSATASAVHDPV